MLVEAVKELRAEKDGQIASLQAENRALRQELAGLEARLVALEQASVTSAPPGSAPFAPWWLLGGLVVVAGLAIQRRRPGGGG